MQCERMSRPRLGESASGSKPRARDSKINIMYGDDEVTRRKPKQACLHTKSQNRISKSQIEFRICAVEFSLIQKAIEFYEGMARPKRFELLTPRFVVSGSVMD